MPDAAPAMTLAQATQAIDQAVARLGVARIRAANDADLAELDAQLAKLNEAKLALNRSAQQGRAFDEADLETASAASAIKKMRARSRLAR